jgi:anti-sigma factor RsiW
MGSPVCHWVRSVLTAWLDGELKPSTAESVRRHLEHCEACRAERDLLEEAGRLIEIHGEADVPPVRSGFTARMMGRIVEEKDLEALEARLRPHRRRRKVLASLSGLAAGLVVGLASYAWTCLDTEPNSPVERDVSRNVSFLKDVELLDDVAVIEAMDRLIEQAKVEQTAVPDGAVAVETVDLRSVPHPSEGA